MDEVLFSLISGPEGDAICDASPTIDELLAGGLCCGGGDA